jgi:hypothetical protein
VGPAAWFPDIGGKDCGESGSARLAGREVQARQKKLAEFRLAVPRCGFHEGRRDRAQPPDDVPCFVEPSSMGIAGGIAVRLRKARIVLSRQEQDRRGVVEPPAEKECRANYSENLIKALSLCVRRHKML